MDIQLFQYICWKDHLFPHCFVLHLCWKSADHTCIYFSILNSVALTYVSIIMSIQYLFYYYGFKINFFSIYFYLFMAVLGLRFCARAFSSCGKRGPLFIAVRGPLTITASLVAEHRLQTRRLSNCGSWVQLLRSMWDLPRPGHEPVSPALAGRFSTTAPPGKP